MNDDTADLLQMFQKLGTTDHDVLIKQMQTIIPGIDPSLCSFFLEASNWTLQTAIHSFFDSTGGQDLSQQIAFLNKPKPSAQFILKDDGVNQHFTDTAFSKVWLVTNSGSIPWPEGCSLNFIGGDQLGGPKTLPAPVLPPGTTVEITLHFRTPPHPGQFAGSWMMTTNAGDGPPIAFGEQLWVIVVAVPNPHQTSQGWSGFGAPDQPQPNTNNNDMTLG